ELGYQLVVMCTYTQRRGRGIRNRRAYGRNVGWSVRIDGIGHHDYISIIGRIDPDRCPGETRVTEGTNRKELTAITRKRRIDIPSRSAQRSAGRRLSWRCHLKQRDPLQWEAAMTAVKPIDQVLSKDRDIACAAEETGMSCDSTHAARSRIMDRPAQHHS